MGESSDRPNVIVIIPHDLGTCLGCYGNRRVRTPHLDRLASEGVRLANHFAAAPECTPSRASMFTGLQTHQTGLMGLCHRGWGFDADAVHLGQYLHRSGYETHLFGHQHETHGDPARLGYEHIHCRDDHMSATVSAQMAAFLEGGPETGSRPWFAHVGFLDPHRGSRWPQTSSFDPDDIDVPAHLPDNPVVRAELARYYQAIETMDAGVGRIVSALKASPLYDNMLVIFTADHGSPFPRSKSTFYDPGIRTPLICHWPGRIEGGGVYQQLISNLDLCPTVLEACGVPVPDGLAGRSYWPLLQGVDYRHRDAVYGVLYYDAVYDPMCYVRTDRLKYIRSFTATATDAEGADPTVLAKHDMGTWIRAGDTDVARSDAWKTIPGPYDPVPAEELYDLANDPAEQKNLVGEPAYGEALEQMRTKLASMLKQTNSPLLTGHVSPELSRTRNQHL